MNELKMEVIGYSDKGIADLYLYYIDKDDNIVATIAVNNQGDLISDIFNDDYKERIVSDINKLTGFNFSVEEEYFYINNNEVVWNNTRKFIQDNNIKVETKTELDMEIEELSKTR